MSLFGGMGCLVSERRSGSAEPNDSLLIGGSTSAEVPQHYRLFIFRGAFDTSDLVFEDG